MCLPLAGGRRTVFSGAAQEAGKFHLQVAPEKTHLRRFSRFHPSTKRRFTFLGFEFFWMPDRHGVPRVMRTARKLQAACQRLTAWIKQHRHLPRREFFQRLNARLRGLQLLWRARERPLAHPLFHWAMDCTFKWLNRRRGKQRSYTWEQFTHVLDRVKVVRPLLRRSHVGECLPEGSALHRGREYNRGTGCGKTASGSARGAPGNRRSYRRDRSGSRQGKNGCGFYLRLSLSETTPNWAMSGRFSNHGRRQHMKVTLLGTGTPILDIHRFGMSTLVEAGGQQLLFDAGRGVAIRTPSAEGAAA